MTAACPRCGLLHPPRSPCFSLNLTTLGGNDELQAGATLGGCYRVERLLHHGGMSAVYLATDLRHGGPVALKELRLPAGAILEEQQEAEAWFAREASLLSTLRHSAVPTFYAGFADSGRSYIAQEYVEGENLERLIVEHGSLDEGTVVALGRILCSLLDHLHELPVPVVFRDLKPANIVLRPDGRRLAMVDFGIARPYQPGEVGTVIGTPGYAPPEQYQGLATPQSDIYALGATMHRLLTGYDPEHGPPFTFPPVRDLSPVVSPLVSAIVERAVNINPADRFSSAAEMGAMLGRIGNIPPTVATRAAPARGLQWIRLAVALAGLLLLPAATRWAHRSSGSSSSPAQTTVPRSTVITPAERGTCLPDKHGSFSGEIQSMTLGPDGAIWFIGADQRRIGRITAAGQVTACRPSYRGYGIAGIVTSGDVIWFKSGNAGDVRYLTPSGQVTAIHLPQSFKVVNDMAPGAAGSIWMIDNVDGGAVGGVGELAQHSGAYIAHITPAGRITDFPIPVRLGWVEWLGADSGGGVWFMSETSDGKFGHLDPSGRMTFVSLPPFSTFTPGPRATVWYSTGDESGVGQASPEGTSSTYKPTSTFSLEAVIDRSVPIDPAYGRLGSLVVDRQGNVWFPAHGVVGSTHIAFMEITAKGQLHQYPMPEEIDPGDCLVGPDGAIWFIDDADAAVAKIGRLAPDGSVREYATAY